jgi:hypothetical protein
VLIAFEAQPRTMAVAATVAVADWPVDASSVLLSSQLAAATTVADQPVDASSALSS